MKKFTLIVGNISFDNNEFAEIHSIAFVKQYASAEAAINIGEEMISRHEGYIIPELYKEKPIIFDMHFTTTQS